jgi:choline dehydrogenase-like flavoprotein
VHHQSERSTRRRRAAQQVALSVLDLRSLPAGTELVTDVCVIGAGPAGLTLAAELAHGPVRVLVTESGGLEPEPEASALNEVENVGVARVARQELVRTRALGGTSHIWSGRCAALDQLDLQQRSWVPHSGWPLSGEDLAPYLERARSYLGLGPNVYDEEFFDLRGQPRPGPPIHHSLTPRFWQFARSRAKPWLPTRFDRDVLPAGADNVRILLHATATHIETNPDGTAVQSAGASCVGGPRVRITAQAFVLCAGGIENARLLLASDRVIPGGVGNTHDLVGRYLMDHPGMVIASIPPALARSVRDRFGRYWLDGPEGRHSYLHGVALSPEIQREEKLLNCAAFLDEYPAADDPWHAGQRLLARLRGKEPTEDHVELASFWRRDYDLADEIPPSATRDVRAILRHGPSVVGGAYRMARQRRPPLFRARRVDVYCLTEQLPDPSSRVTLSDRRDALGIPIPRIDWRIADVELRSVRRLEELLGDALIRLGHARPVAASWPANERDAMVDRAHPMGTTRMADDPHEGVVDRDGRVHGVDGLYVAGSSVFPTSGHVNPTLTIVALAIRLADHLKQGRLRP